MRAKGYICHSTDTGWKAERLKGIGASEAATIILGRHHGRTPMQLWLEKTGVEERPDIDDVEYIVLGRDLETWVMERWRRETLRWAGPCGALYRHAQHPWMLATPDFWWLDEASEIVGLLECKTAGNLRAWDDGIPEAYQIQLQHQMAVMDCARASIAVLAGGATMGYRWADLDRDDTFIDYTLIPELAKFWESVETREPPPVDDRAETGRALAKLYAGGGQESVCLGGEFVDIFDKVGQLKGEEQAIKARRTLLENRVKAAMRDAEIGVLPNGNAFTWKVAHRKAYTKTIEASTYRVLRRKERR